jgi:hypothetical protein
MNMVATIAGKFAGFVFCLKCGKVAQSLDGGAGLLYIRCFECRDTYLAMKKPKEVLYVVARSHRSTEIVRKILGSDRKPTWGAIRRTWSFSITEDEIPKFDGIRGIEFRRWSEKRERWSPYKGAMLVGRMNRRDRHAEKASMGS